MKVERTVFHIETEDEKELLLSILAKEILNNAKVEEDFQQTPLAELNEIPQYIPRPDDAMAMPQITEDSIVELDDKDKEKSAGPVGQLIRLMTNIKDKHGVNHETPVYVHETEEPQYDNIEEIDPTIRFGDSYGRIVDIPVSLVNYIRNK